MAGGGRRGTPGDRAGHDAKGKEVGAKDAGKGGDGKENNGQTNTPSETPPQGSQVQERHEARAGKLPSQAK